jgi:hypothetical protein
MQLRDFIQETLYEIALGVHLAKIKSKDLIAVNPGTLNGERLNEKSYIDFDVSLVVNEKKNSSSSGSGKIGGEIKVASIAKFGAEVGGAGGSSAENSSESTHRVAFKVPVYMNAHFRGDKSMAEEAAFISSIADPRVEA